MRVTQKALQSYIDNYSEYDKYPPFALRHLPLQVPFKYPHLDDPTSIIAASYIGFYLLPANEKEYKAKVKKIINFIQEALDKRRPVSSDDERLISESHNYRLNALAKIWDLKDFNHFKKYLTQLDTEAAHYGFLSYENLYRPSQYLDFRINKLLSQGKNPTLSEEQRHVLSQCLPFQIDLFFASQLSSSFSVEVYKHWMVFFELEENEIIVHPPTEMKLNRSTQEATEKTVYYVSAENEYLCSRQYPELLSSADCDRLRDLAVQKFGNFPVNFDRYVRVPHVFHNNLTMF